MSRPLDLELLISLATKNEKRFDAAARRALGLQDAPPVADSGVRMGRKWREPRSSTGKQHGH